MPKSIEIDVSEVLKTIQANAWFNGVADDVTQHFSDFATVEQYEVGEKVYKPKSELKNIYGVLSGQIKVSLVGDGNQYFSIMDFHEQFWFGESSLLNGQSSVMDVTAVKKSNIIILPASEFQKVADQNPLIYRNLYYGKMRQMQLSNSMFASVLTYPLAARLSLRLLALVNERGFKVSQGVCLSPAPTVSEWATLAMGSVQRVDKIIQGWIASQYMIEDSVNDRCIIPDIHYFELEATA